MSTIVASGGGLGGCGSRPPSQSCCLAVRQRAPYAQTSHDRMEVPLRFALLIIAALVTVAAANVSLAQSTAPPSAETRATCPPDVKGEPPTVGGGSSEPLSDQLARSKGHMPASGS
jgi:hypothetical protein